MNNKGQGALEYLLLIGGGILVAVIILTLVTLVTTSNHDSAAENFCRAWSDERGYTYLDGRYETFLIQGRAIDCTYSANADVFDGGVSAGTREHKYFDISEEALLEWANKSESKDCCEVCE